VQLVPSDIVRDFPGLLEVVVRNQEALEQSKLCVPLFVATLHAPSGPDNDSSSGALATRFVRGQCRLQRVVGRL